MRRKTQTSRSRAGKTRKREAPAGYRRAEVPSLPLEGYTLPAVDLERGSRGTGVRQLQTALVKLGHMTQAQMDTGPGTFGARTEGSLKRFQEAQGVDAIGVYGPKTRAAFKALGATLGGAETPAGLREKIVAEGLWGVANQDQIHYAQIRPIDGLQLRHKLPLDIDCSGFVTLCYKWAGAPDPNGNRYSGAGYTGTLEAHMLHIPLSQVRPGDLCLWQGKHVSLVIQGGEDPLLISHGSEAGPYEVRTSTQKKWYPAGTRLIWLTSPEGAKTRARRTLSREDKARGDPPAEEGLF
ncbi:MULTISPECIES: peptidoglycan-binding protein [unclassified Corallococcus]|uniref:peptidoglycan-binding protein n=1 Tax=unclassified Corallococcus TaxID=2685029 RepID=UPI001F5D1D15|nr:MULTISPECIES: peptidoglycan-binding protein [unclassified Corallococcus]WAS84590.1 peptidoglycan-binding protein [Corallococcus sp. NCRR]